MIARWQVRGRHRVGCMDCELDFNGTAFYLHNVAPAHGPWGASGESEKLCVDCMGGKLKLAVGTEAEVISAKLTQLRSSQGPSGIACGAFVQRYWRD